MISKWAAQNLKQNKVCGAAVVKRAPVYLVNLKGEAGRRIRMKRQFSGTGIKYHTISAHDCHDERFPFFLYKEFSGQWWDRYDHFKPGAFGCFLSHAECWMKVATGSAPYGIVMEDDIELNVKAFWRCMEDIAGMSFDVIYLSERMHSWLDNAKIQVGEHDGKTYSVSSLLCRLLLDGTYSEKVPPPGTDGYVVSKKGALKLLYMMQSRGINMGVDYAMALNTLNQDQLERLRGVGADRLPFSVRCILHNEAHRLEFDAPVCLDSHIYAPQWVVRLTPSIPSTIRHEVYCSNELFDAEPAGFFERISIRRLSRALSNGLKAFFHSLS